MEASPLPIKFEQLDELSRWPIFSNHRDRFGLLLIAPAISEDLTLVSSDTRFPGYVTLRVF
jgi:PIN domain nuclease of toxin-antitoxin system